MEENQEIYNFRVKKQIPSKEVNKHDEVVSTFKVQLSPADEETKSSISNITLTSTDSGIFEDFPLKTLVEVTLAIDKKQQTLS